MTAFGGALTDPTKIMGSRVGAFLVDLVLMNIVIFGLFYVFQLNGYDAGTFQDSASAASYCANRVQTEGACYAIGSTVYELDGDQAVSAQLTLWVYSIVVTALNWVVLPAATGASLGKMLFGLRIVTPDGQRAGIGRNLLRWLGGIVDFACCAIPGYVIAKNSAGHRRLGDRMGGTLVIHKSAAGRLLNVPGFQVVTQRADAGAYGAAAGPSPLAGGMDAPVWDPARNTYVRYDQNTGIWFQWDDRSQTWVAAEV